MSKKKKDSPPWNEDAPQKEYKPWLKYKKKLEKLSKEDVEFIHQWFAGVMLQNRVNPTAQNKMVEQYIHQAIDNLVE